MAEKLLIDMSQQSLNRELPGESVHALIHRLQAMNVRIWEDSFLGDTIKSGYAVDTNDNGTFTIESDDDHAKLAASTGAGTDNDYAGVALPGLAFKAEQNPIAIWRVAFDATTTVKGELGWTDAKGDAGAVNALSTPTFTADDAAVWCFDTDDTAYWQCVGVKATAAATKIEPEIAPTAATYEYMGVALRDTFAKFLRWNDSGLLTYESAWMADAITADDPITPWMFVQARAGSIDRNVQFQKMLVASNYTSS